MHSPPPVIEYYEDGIDPEAGAVAHLLSRHLEGSITQQDKWPVAGGQHVTNAGRDTKAHGSIICGRHEHGRTDLQGGEQAITSI